MRHTARVGGIAVLCALSLILVGPLLPDTTPLAEILRRGLGIGLDLGSPSGTGGAPPAGTGSGGLSELPRSTPIPTPSARGSSGTGPLFDFSAASGVPLGGGGASIPLASIAIIGGALGLLAVRRFGALRLVATLAVVAAEFVSLLLAAPGLALRSLAGKLGVSGSGEADTSTEPQPSVGAPDTRTTEPQPAPDSAEAATVRDAWAYLTTHAPTSRGSSTTTVAEAAVDAGLPRDAVETIRSAYRDVRYGHKPATGRVDEVRTATDRLEQAVSAGQEEEP